MISDSVEMAAKVVIPLEVRVGARDCHLALRPGEQSAQIDLLNTEDGHEYTVTVMRKQQPRPSSDSPESKR
jgi:hypothetical protein